MNEGLDWTYAIDREHNYLMRMLVQVGDDQVLDQGGSHMKTQSDVSPQAPTWTVCYSLLPGIKRTASGSQVHQLGRWTSTPHGPNLKIQQKYELIMDSMVSFVGKAKRQINSVQGSVVCTALDEAFEQWGWLPAASKGWSLLLFHHTFHEREQIQEGSKYHS